MQVFKLKDGTWGYRVLVKDADGTSKNMRAIDRKKQYGLMLNENQ